MNASADGVAPQQNRSLRPYLGGSQLAKKRWSADSSDETYVVLSFAYRSAVVGSRTGPIGENANDH